MKTAAIISYSSYHNPYIERCIAEAKKVADEVVVVSHSHFYDGMKDTGLLIFPESLPPLTYLEGSSSRSHHNELRKFGYDQLKSDYDAYFFIDSDEILNGDLVKEWLQTIKPGTDHKLSHYWYYRDTCYRANQVEEGAVLVSRETLESSDMEWFGERERENYSKKWYYMASYKGKVLGHHYSWAGTKEMLQRKVRSWGHKDDNVDWEQMVEDEFTHEFRGCPFRPGYEFQRVEPFIDFTLNT